MKKTAQEITELSRAHGVLAKQFYVIFTTPTGGLGPILDNMKDHLEFQMSLEKQGIMFAAGPNWTADGQSWEGDGMVVVRAKSIDDAKAIAARDPMHVRGARKYSVRPWMINEGTINVRLDYSTGKFHIE